MHAVLSSRIQFGGTLMFHYLFVPITIGLSLVLVVIEATYLATDDPVYKQLAQFWAGIFGLNFAIGVATGIPMEFQFGTNWAQYSRYVGDVFGSALAAEGIFAFFLESGFLAIVLFGWDRVSRRVHFLATCLVCFASHFSAVWVLVANSWMQTPDGFQIAGNGAGARAVTVDFTRVVLNHSTLQRLSHTLSGAWQAGAFFVLSVSAWYLLRDRFTDPARRAFKIGLVVAAFAASFSIFTGDLSAKEVARYQPAKLAAMEGVFDSATTGAPLHLFGIVNVHDRTVAGPAIPKLLSWLAHGDVNAAVTGLGSFPRDLWPPVQWVFQSFHMMVGIGFALLGLTLLGLWGWWRGTLFQARWLLWPFVFAIGAALVANELGWATAELGRQPWIVYGLLRTSQGVSPTVRTAQVWASVALFALVYLILGALYVVLLNQKIQHGPEPAEARDTEPMLAHGERAQLP